MNAVHCTNAMATSLYITAVSYLNFCLVGKWATRPTWPIPFNDLFDAQ